jgi:hypothetical protein
MLASLNMNPFGTTRLLLLCLVLSSALPSGAANLNKARLIEEKSGRSHVRRCLMTRKTVAITDPVHFTDARVVFDHYEPRAGSVAQVLILPPTGGENLIDRLYARDLCKRGLGAVLVKTWSYDTETSLDLSVHDNGYKRALNAVRATLKFVPGRVGILGTSLGALYAATLLASEERIETGVIIVGGSPLSEILATSTIPGVTQQRENRIKKLKLQDNQDYQDLMDTKIHLDASNFLPLSRGKSALMVTALKDKIVPTSTQLGLWEELGRPARIDIKAGHLGAMISAYTWHRRSIEDFLVQELSR